CCERGAEQHYCKRGQQLEQDLVVTGEGCRRREDDVATLHVGVRLLSRQDRRDVNSLYLRRGLRSWKPAADDRHRIAFGADAEVSTESNRLSQPDRPRDFIGSRLLEVTKNHDFLLERLGNIDDIPSLQDHVLGPVASEKHLAKLN